MTATEENVPSSRTDELQRVLFAIAVTLGLTSTRIALRARLERFWRT